MPPTPPEHLERGLHLSPAPSGATRRTRCRHSRRRRRADYVFARVEARTAGADDALFLTIDGFISEATSANIFVVRGDELATPALACAILPGTTRSWILRWAAGVGLRPAEEWLTIRHLLEADEAFISSSVAGILPVTRIDGEPIGEGGPGHGRSGHGQTGRRSSAEGEAAKPGSDPRRIDRQDPPARARKAIGSSRTRRCAGSRPGSSFPTTCSSRPGARWTATTYRGSWSASRRQIVRGRPMTPDEEAAYVREVAEAKTAALADEPRRRRAAGDAVRRRGTGDGPGPGHGHARPATRPVTASSHALAAGGERQVPAPDPIARDYLLLGLRLDQHIPGLVDGYFGPADLKAQVDMSQLRPPARLADDAAALLARLPAEVDDDATPGVAVRAARRPSDAGGGAGRRRAAVPRAPRAVLRLDAGAARRRDLRCGGRGARRDPSGRRAARRPPRGLGRPVRDPGRSAPRRRRLARRPVPGARRAALRPAGRRGPQGQHRDEPAVVRLQLVRRRACGRGWTSTRTFRFGRPTSSTRSRTRRSPAITSSMPGRRPTSSSAGRLEASILLINTPECLISEGLADLGCGVRVAARARRSTCSSSCSIGRDCRSPRTRPPPARRPSGPWRCGGPAGGSRRCASTRRSCATPTASPSRRPGLPRAGRALASQLAEKRLEFIEHPLWRTYVFVYHEGEALLRRWLEAVPEADRRPDSGACFTSS